MTTEEKIRKVFSHNLSKLLKERNSTQLDLAHFMNVSNTTVNNWVNGYKMPRMDKIDRICVFLGINRTALLTETPPPIPQFDNIHQVAPVKIPILGRIACGEPIFEAEDFQGYTDFISKIHVDFCLIAQGDSMIGARIHDGDVVFIRQQPEVENGEIAAVSINDEVTLKRIYIYDNQIVLNAENPKYAPMIYSLDQIESFRILGKAVAFQSKIV